MLNADYKKQAIQDLREIDKEYTEVFGNAISDMERLQNTRNIAVRAIQCVERYVITLKYDMSSLLMLVKKFKN